jgi:endonuclease/exonuclease/phosphatase family metal-dependent hydrolase
MAQTIRLCTWNIEFGFQLSAIMDAVQACSDFAGLDLLALQEASAHFGVKDARALAHALGKDYEYFQVTAQHVEGKSQANALVWNAKRVQVFEQSSVKLPHMHEVQRSRTERALLRRLPPQERISLVVEGKIAAQTVRIYVAHLDVIGYRHKRQQFERILSDAQTRTACDLTVIAGDLNTFRIRSRPKWTTLEQDARQAGFQDLTSEIRWTHSIPRLRLRQKLDAIFVKCAQPAQCRSWSLPIAGSDHIPVFAEINMGA